MLFDYFKCFYAWKKPDEAKLVCRIKHALIALYNAQDLLPYNELDNSNIIIEFKTQIERLRNKLQQLAGLETLIQFDEEHNPSLILGQFNKQLNIGINKNS